MARRRNSRQSGNTSAKTPQEKGRQSKGGGSVFPRKDGRWVAQVTLPNGEQKQFYAKTKKEASDKLRVALREVEQELLLPDPDQRLAQYLDDWLEQSERRTLKVGSYARYRSIVDTHLIPGLGHLSLRKLRVEHLDRFYTAKQADGLAPATIHLIHNVLHRALETAVKRHYVSHNVSDDVTLPRISRREIRPLSKEQADHLLEVARGHRLETLIALAVTTGMRRGELLALRWEDIDWQHGVVAVRRTVNRYGAGVGYVVSEPKTTRGRRTIVVPAFVLDLLRVHRSQQDDLKAQAGETWQEQNLVFPSAIGTFFHPNRLLKDFDRLLQEADLPHIRFHDLRHSAATILLSLGVHPKVVQEILGHSEISMTLDTYSHVLPTLQQDAMAKLDQAFGKVTDHGDEEAHQGP